MTSKWRRFKMAWTELSSGSGAVNTSPWAGKTFVSLGTSISWQDGQSGYVGYQSHLKNNLGFASYNNQGVSGDAMVSGTNPVGKSLSYTSYDLVIIESGTNDFKLNKALGTLGLIGDTTFSTGTFYGAYRDLIEYILTNKPTIRIVLFTPLQRDNGGYDVNFTNTAGHRLIDYVNAVKEIGAMYGIPVCDMYGNSGFTKLTLATYTRDGLHPNNIGYVRMGNYASKFIGNIGL
jgi:lysophospholipase L1-like esterase